MHLSHLLPIIYHLYIIQTVYTNANIIEHRVDSSDGKPSVSSISSQPYHPVTSTDSSHALSKRVRNPTRGHIFWRTNAVRLHGIAYCLALYIFGTSSTRGPYVMAMRLSILPDSTGTSNTVARLQSSATTLTSSTNWQPLLTSPDPSNLLNHYFATAREIGPIERVEYAIPNMFPGGGTAAYSEVLDIELRAISPPSVPILGNTYEFLRGFKYEVEGKRYEPGLQVTARPIVPVG